MVSVHLLILTICCSESWSTAALQVGGDVLPHGHDVLCS